jgi:catechol 1,2-dioxygenase
VAQPLSHRARTEQPGHREATAPVQDLLLDADLDDPRARRGIERERRADAHVDVAEDTHGSRYAHGAGFGAAALGTASWLGGCGQVPTTSAGADLGESGADAGAADLALPGADLSPTPECRETEDDILGPYYRAGAPFRDTLFDDGMKGTRLTVNGTVSGIGGAGCVPLAGALVDVWQADADAHYDNDGSIDPLPPGLFILRGRFYSDGNGAFRLRTIIPGRYLNGNQYRPAHLHVRLSADGHRPLTTQLFFADDPFNSIDPWFKPSLAMTTTDDSEGKLARFDFVLPRV